MQSQSDKPPGVSRVDLRTAAMRVVRSLTEAGNIAYFAGGCVRDRLMGLEPTDYDIATDARPDAVGRLFRKSQHVGESFGVMLVSSMGHQIQVAAFRTEGVYSDGRHPDTVAYSDARHDAQRRDFTINGLFENPLTGELIDFVGGQADLKAKLIRAIGDPHARLREDRLRMLRAVRFSARFGFAIDAATSEAIRADADDLRGLSPERIGQELKQMLSDRNRAVAAMELQALGLDQAVLHEPHQAAALNRLGRLPADVAYPTALAAWLLDRHEDADADVTARARRWSAALLLSNADQMAMSRCLDVYETLRGAWPQLSVAKQKRLAAGGEFDEALLLLQATDPQAFARIRREVSVLAESDLAPPALIGGHDLIALGLPRGPLFKRVLDAVYDAQLEGTVREKAAALALAKTISLTEEGGSSDS
ncbi:MAG: CCA tRNA nucleotidyltransferase [Planctomycetota bacterium]|nr:CCA tRNA nucleotidyltransferase [Planctomycetota bacterium]MCZ6736329.1 CCA tRNA nucleotidyltransferase [Planctomycetota bacterium]